MSLESATLTANDLVNPSDPIELKTIYGRANASAFPTRDELSDAFQAAREALLTRSQSMPKGYGETERAYTIARFEILARHVREPHSSEYKDTLRALVASRVKYPGGSGMEQGHLIVRHLPTRTQREFFGLVAAGQTGPVGVH